MDALRNVREKLLHCELLIPCGLIMKVSEDIVRMSHSEPCGIRGCILYINLEEKDKCQHLIKLPLDPSTVATFELHLTLKEDVRSVCHIKKFFLTVSGCLQENPSSWNFSWRILCSGFTLEKKKLYRLQS
ncbi:hypothetical protein FSP39_006871 [Pinctada imbricata]|uniref:Uncharacterized protein n=1 Tax=Pinctada imbricata TaxID=66713 RepID=A0AA89BSV7_PINIB|nr:hypothetical protein FSP39_006871 [Pinctada imbricata]